MNEVKHYFQHYQTQKQKQGSNCLKLVTLLLLIAYSLLPVAVKSQQYPVKLVPVIIPPYSRKEQR